MTEPASENNASTTDNRPDEALVSILLRTKNEEAFLGKTLSVLFSQTYKNYEVIIVDSGSTDRTLEVAGEYPVSIYEIKPEDFTFGYSLNYGFLRAKGEYVVCLSAHALPLSKDWLKVAISNFDDETVAAVMTKTLPWPDCNPFDKRGILKKFDIPKQEIAEGPLSNYIYANSNSVIRRDLWEKVRFDENLTASEDHDWVRKVRKLHYKVIYEPGAEVYHSHNETLKQIYARYNREAYSVKVLNMKRYTLAGLVYDLIAGTIYDMLYVLYKMENIKWLFFAPLRRLTMNYARFMASWAFDMGKH